MKKTAVVGISAVLAALPMVGVFAATSSSFQDTLTVNISSGCTLEDNSAADHGTYNTDRAFSATITAGTYKELGNGFNSQTGKTIKVACNVSTGNWTVTATASNSGALKDGSYSINPGTDKSGNTSGWAIKSNASADAVSDPYATYKAYAVDTGQTFSTFLTGSASGTAVTFNPSYQVYVAPGQEPGNYTGTITYTISM